MAPIVAAPDTLPAAKTSVNLSSSMSMYVRSRKFCCFLPVRLGVFVGFSFTLSCRYLTCANFTEGSVADCHVGGLLRCCDWVDTSNTIVYVTSSVQSKLELIKLYDSPTPP